MMKGGKEEDCNHREHREEEEEIDCEKCERARNWGRLGCLQGAGTRHALTDGEES